MKIVEVLYVVSTSTVSREKKMSTAISDPFVSRLHIE